MSVLLAAGKAS